MLLWRLQQYIHAKRKTYADWQKSRTEAKRCLGKPCVLYEIGCRGIPGHVVEVGLLGFRFRNFAGQDSYVEISQSLRLSDGYEDFYEIVKYHARNNVKGMPSSLWRFLNRVLPPQDLEEVGKRFGHIRPAPASTP